MRWLIVLVALLLGLALAWRSGAFFKPGAGAAYQTAPDSVAAGAPAEISLRLAVWGAGGPASTRYRNVRLAIGPVADPSAWRSLAPARAADAADGVTFFFSFPAPRTPGVELGYRFTFEFDGSTSTVEGLKHLAIK